MGSTCRGHIVTPATAMKLPLTLSEGVMRGSALGDVAGDLGEALQVSLLVADRIYDD